MKKIILMALISGVSVCALAGSKGWTKEQYFEKRKEWADGKHNVNEDKVFAQFEKLDTDEDGLLTTEERLASKKKKLTGSKKKSRKSSRKSTKSKRSERFKRSKKARSGGKGWTKEQYLEKRKEWADGAYNVNEDKVFAQFEKLDADEDGLLTKAERTAGKK